MKTKNLLTIIAAFLFIGCGKIEPPKEEPAASSDQWAECGVNRQCSSGLECFGVCTFECGDKYDSVGKYGFDQESSDRCASIGGSCRQLGSIQINVCQQPFKMPSSCSIGSEAMRSSVCPSHPVAINCTNVEQTNPLPEARCTGPDYTGDHQVTGNGWCCDDMELVLGSQR